MNYLDNRHKNKSAALEEIENDTTPIDEGENPKDDKEADGHIADPENEEEIVVEEEKEEKELDNKEEELEEEKEELEEEKKEVKKTEKQTQNLPDAEERLAEQRREATILNEKNKQLSDAFTRANELADPTEDELKKQARVDGFDWDELTLFEQSQYKRSVVSERRLAILNEVGSKVSNIDKWAVDVDKYLDDNERDQTNKSLIGHEGAFRSFAMKESHRGASMDLLVSAFLHDLPKEKTKTNGSIMLTRTGGEKVEKVNKLQDADYVASLRKSDPKEYNRLVAKGQINIEP